uniref:Uncharacterized protein n=1 Tax=Scleropages formosus TaxID=113540 RepID=A0A8C9V337_SCLFO
LGAFIVLGVMYFLSTTSKQGKESPGPRSLPLIGNLLQLDLKRPHVSLTPFSPGPWQTQSTHHFPPKRPQRLQTLFTDFPQCNYLH